MGAAWTQSSPGCSGKVQPPVDRAAEPACGYFPSQCVGRGKSLVGRIPTQHFPGKSVAAERGDDIIGGFIAPVRQMCCPVHPADPQPISPICARTNSSAASARSEEHTSELQSLMRISYAVFCLKKKKRKNNRD